MAWKLLCRLFKSQQLLSVCCLPRRHVDVWPGWKSGVVAFLLGRGGVWKKSCQFLRPSGFQVSSSVWYQVWCKLTGFVAEISFSSDGIKFPWLDFVLIYRGLWSFCLGFCYERCAGGAWLSIVSWARRTEKLCSHTWFFVFQILYRSRFELGINWERNFRVWLISCPS